MRFPRLIAGLAAAALPVAGLTLVVAPAASAATVTVPFVCTTNAFGVDYDAGVQSVNVTITAPTTAAAGDTIPVSYAFPGLASPLPFAITGATLTPTATVIGRGPGGNPVSSSTGSGPTISAATIAAAGVVPTASTITVPFPTIISSSAYILDVVPGTFSIQIAASNELPPNSSITCESQDTSIVAANTSLTGVTVPPPTDRCVAYQQNQTGGDGCDTTQVVSVSLTQGRLVQRAYVNTTPATGNGVIDGSAITSPVVGTPTVNTSATEVNLGSIISPLVPTVITGRLNDVTVTDNRGGTNGWSLTADMADPDVGGPLGARFNGSLGNVIAASALAASPTCLPADEFNAWDYTDPGTTVLAGFDGTLNAPGFTAGASSQAFGGSAVALCTKSTTANATTQSSGGVYTVGATLNLLLPAFQAADRYNAVVTITLA